MSDELSEAEIVRGLRVGDRAAWDALCNLYDRRLWSYVSRLIGSDTAAVADVYQETMLAVARSGLKLNDESKLWPWLARIGHNQAALYWRQRYRAHPLVDCADDVVADCDDPLATLAKLEVVESVRSLLTEMDADYVTLLIGKYIDALSVAELVILMGGTNESVRSRLARARRDFRERYQRVAAKF